MANSQDIIFPSSFYHPSGLPLRERQGRQEIRRPAKRSHFVLKSTNIIFFRGDSCLGSPSFLFFFLTSFPSPDSRRYSRQGLFCPTFPCERSVWCQHNSELTRSDIVDYSIVISTYRYRSNLEFQSRTWNGVEFSEALTRIALLAF